jgi:hypothetical protein
LAAVAQVRSTVNKGTTGAAVWMTLAEEQEAAFKFAFRDRVKIKY